MPSRLVQFDQETWNALDLLTRRHQRRPLDSNRSLSTFEPVSVRDCELPRGKGLARPETGAVILATLAYSGRQRSRYLASPAKATESQRLFRRRQETGIAQDCVVGLAGLKPTANRLWA